MTVLLLCGSRKPGPGQPEVHSATRELLKLAEEGVQHAGERPLIVDLRQLELPFFDGRPVEGYGALDLIDLKRLVVSADAVLLAVPVYWRGVAGVLKNALDLLGGAAYESPNAATPWTGKPVAMLLVGAAHGDAEAGRQQLQQTMEAMGAQCYPEAVVVDNPRQAPDLDRVAERAFALGYALAQLVQLRPGESDEL